jgi:hypothetical protein
MPRRSFQLSKTRKKNSSSDISADCASNEFYPEIFWEDFQCNIADALSRCHLGATLIYNIVNPKLRTKFTSQWLLSHAGVPVMTFHCTRESNVSGIIENGLVIPGSLPGVTVQNGSAYGVGIYTARTPQISYCSGGRFLFVCAALVGERFTTTTKMTGDMIILFDSAQILPCFLVEFNLKPDTTIPIYMPNTGKKWPFKSISSPSDSVGTSSALTPPANNAKAVTTAATTTTVPDPPMKGWEIEATHTRMTKKRLKKMSARVKELYRNGELRQIKIKRN